MTVSFAWPFGLAVALAVPAVLAVYLWESRGRRRQAVRFSSVALLRSVMPRTSAWRRHLPVAFLLTSLGILALASGGPQVDRTVTIGRTSVILALDVSLSMCATDVEPNRMTVAQQAARAFVQDQPDGTRTGLVVFAGFAQLVVPPTTDRKALAQAIDGLTTARGTAIGSAILKSLDALADVNPDVEPVGDAPPPQAAEPGAEDGFVPDIIVLLTDGANTRGIPPLDAAAYAVERRVRVYTIGFGTAAPTGLVCTAQQLGAELGEFGGAGTFGGAQLGFGGRSPLRADEATLRKVADETGGAYFGATDAAQLRNVFSDLPRSVELQKERREITVFFAAIGAILAAAAIFASMRWSPYP